MKYIKKFNENSTNEDLKLMIDFLLLHGKDNCIEFPDHPTEDITFEEFFTKMISKDFKYIKTSDILDELSSDKEILDCEYNKKDTIEIISEFYKESKYIVDLSEDFRQILDIRLSSGSHLYMSLFSEIDAAYVILKFNTFGRNDKFTASDLVSIFTEVEFISKRYSKFEITGMTTASFVLNFVDV